ncbi:MAG: hypothetical protein ABFC78_09665 [Methanoregula sp.]
MREINLDPYFVEAELPDGTKKPFPYIVKQSICGALFLPEQRLGMAELLDNDRLAQKIKAWPEGSPLLLEEAEYQKIRAAFEAHRGYTEHDVELVRRIMNAPEVAVTKAAKKAAGP